MLSEKPYKQVFELIGKIQKQGNEQIDTDSCNNYIQNVMPVRKVSGGYQWGTSGKVYPTKAQAERQGKAILASGWREKKTK